MRAFGPVGRVAEFSRAHGKVDGGSWQKKKTVPFSNVTHTVCSLYTVNLVYVLYTITV